MEKEERLKKIAELRKAEDLKVKMQNEQKARDLANYMLSIKLLSKRAKDLLDVAKELDTQGFTLGEIKSDSNGISKSPLFVSEAISHRFGFLVERNPFGEGKNLNPYAIGIRGGGCCGEDHTINENGDFVKFNKDIYSRGSDYFITLFNKFENAFYEYLDNLK